MDMFAIYTGAPAEAVEQAACVKVFCATL